MVARGWQDAPLFIGSLQGGFRTDDRTRKAIPFGPTTQPLGIKVSPNGARVAFDMREGVTVYSSQTGAVLGQVVLSGLLGWADDDTLIAFTGRLFAFRYDGSGARNVFPSDPRLPPVSYANAALAPDGKQAALLAADLAIVSTASGDELHRFGAPADRPFIAPLFWTISGSLLSINGPVGGVTVLDPKTGTTTRWTLPAQTCDWALWDATTLVTVMGVVVEDYVRCDGQMHRFNTSGQEQLLASGLEVGSLSAGGRPLFTALSPDHAKVALALDDTIVVVDPDGAGKQVWAKGFGRTSAISW